MTLAAIGSLLAAAPAVADINAYVETEFEIVHLDAVGPGPVTLDVSVAGDRVIARSTGPIAPGDGCVALAADRVSCGAAAMRVRVTGSPAADAVTLHSTPVSQSWNASGGDGDDELSIVGGPGILSGDAGDDVLRASPGAELDHDVDGYLAGGPGDDVIEGGAGYDGLTGGMGDDRISGGEGWDQIDGGPGNDRLETRDARNGETVGCGAGTADIAVVDAYDWGDANGHSMASSRCERIEFPDHVETHPNAPVPGSWTTPVHLELGQMNITLGPFDAPGGAVLMGAERYVDESDPHRDHATVLLRPGQAPDIAQLGHSGAPLDIGLTPDGTQLALTKDFDDVRFRQRPPGGEFDAGIQLASTAEQRMYVSRRGDVAVVWTDRDDRRWLARIRAAGGEWGPPVEVARPTSPGAGAWSLQHGALLEDGDLTLIWTQTDESGLVELLAGGRRADGTPITPQRIGGPASGRLSSTFASNGRQVAAAWSAPVDGSKAGAVVQDAETGELAAAPLDLGADSGAPRIGIADDGLVTVVSAAGCDLTTRSGRTAQALEVVKVFRTRDCVPLGDFSLEQDPAGVVTLAWKQEWSGAGAWATATRISTEPFGPVQDLVADCAVFSPRLATLGGKPFALLRVGDGWLHNEWYTSVLEPYEGAGRQDCMYPTSYGYPSTDVPAPQAKENLCDGHGPPGTPCGWLNFTPPPPARPTPVTARPSGVLAVGSARVTRTRRTLTARIAIQAPSRSTLAVNASLRRRSGRELAKGAAKRAARGGRTAVTVRLRARSRAARALRRGTRVILRLHVVARPAHGRVLRRTAVQRVRLRG